MKLSNKTEVLAKVCHHRGFGKDNTLQSISAGIKISPFLVEFDVQWSNNALRLGHPPELGKETLDEALQLFTDTNILPKIDIKLTNQSFDQAIDELVKFLEKWKPRKALINISGNLISDGYMQAEKRLMELTDDNTLLNIDLERYGRNDTNTVISHLRNLSRLPFSISPNLKDETAIAINLAKNLGITNIHFWSTFDDKHSIEFLHKQMKLCENNGLVVYFDIKTENICTD